MSASTVRRTLVLAAASASILSGLILGCTRDVPQGNSQNSMPLDHASQALTVSHEFFDDFWYNSPTTDTDLINFGWKARTGGGGPGVNTTWLASNITFSNGIMTLRGEVTNINNLGACTAAELDWNQYKMLNGTYAAYVYYTDTPDTGSLGAQVNEAPFWAMCDYSKYHGTSNYSEVDYEYLPRGGWGLSGPVQTETTWLNDSSSTYSVTHNNYGSWAGWHLVSFQVQAGQPVRWYDGNTLIWTATGGSTYTPRTPMQIIPQIWFINNNILSSWHTSVDWVYYAKDTFLTGSQVSAQVTALRGQGLYRKNTL